MSRSTSLKAYKEIIDEGILGKQEELVADWIHEHPNITDKELSNASGLNINAVTGRRNALVGLGVVESNGKRKCTVTGRTAIQWHIPQEINYKLREQSKLSLIELSRINKLLVKADKEQLLKIETQVKSKLYTITGTIQSSLKRY